ncbi:MAG TPA: hypothetical protein VF704_09810 [Allosphingosinicella sp.]|jgi:hypothetical protein
MFDYDRLVRVATALVGALILSAASVGAAVGPGYSPATGGDAYASMHSDMPANV